jgi:glutamate-1-semialdehyde 2,1-aminomutase
MKTLGIVQARMSSSRLPGKAMMDLGGMPSIAWVVRALQEAEGIDQVLVATTDKDADNPIANWAMINGVACFRGSEDDVISRYMGAARAFDADIIIRTTGDCPLIDPSIISQVIKLRSMKSVMYATNTDPGLYPDGQDVEVFTKEALEIANREATRPSDRECVTRYIVRNRHRISAANLVCPLPELQKERWVLDSADDLKFIQEIVKRLGNIQHAPSYTQILSILDKEPWLRDINFHLVRNERFFDSLAVEGRQNQSYALSKACLDEAEHLIPLGAQTFSKSKLQFPEGAAPLFLTHGFGGYCYDVDGAEYVDLVGGLLPNILGHCDPDVDGAIRDQLNRGISFSLATTLEIDLAERLHSHIPSAEMVRFGKNGSDVTTAAVRLVRHITGRDKIVVGGYHGWHDWSMAVSDRTNGIPDKIMSLSFTKEHIGGFAGDRRNKPAGVIIEPEFFSQLELQEVRQWCSDHEIILIFDEIISGFRCGMGGLQKVTGVTPDLSTFGKAMANGMPISALVGLERYMKHMPEIAYSGTFFGEALSIAASIATIDKIYKYNVPGYLNSIGAYLRGEINVLLDKHGVSGIGLYGEVELNRIKFQDKILQSLFIQEMAKNGVLIIGSHNTCFAHKKPELDRIVTAWDETLKAIAGGVKLQGDIIKGKSVR